MWCRWPYKDGRSLRPLLPLYPSPAICQPCHVRERRAISEYQPRESHLIADLIPMIRRLQYGYNRAQRFRTEKISFGGSLHKHQKSKASRWGTGHRPRNLMMWSASRAQPSHTSARSPLTPVHELTWEKGEMLMEFEGGIPFFITIRDTPSVPLSSPPKYCCLQYLLA